MKDEIRKTDSMRECARIIFTFNARNDTKSRKNDYLCILKTVLLSIPCGGSSYLQ